VLTYEPAFPLTLPLLHSYALIESARFRRFGSCSKFSAAQRFVVVIMAAAVNSRNKGCANVVAVGLKLLGNFLELQGPD